MFKKPNQIQLMGKTMYINFFGCFSRKLLQLHLSFLKPHHRFEPHRGDHSSMFDCLSDRWIGIETGDVGQFNEVLFDVAIPCFISRNICDFFQLFNYTIRMMHNIQSSHFVRQDRGWFEGSNFSRSFINSKKFPWFPPDSASSWPRKKSWWQQQFSANIHVSQWCNQFVPHSFSQQCLLINWLCNSSKQTLKPCVLNLLHALWKKL